jgi:hypothetical protein
MLKPVNYRAAFIFCCVLALHTVADAQTISFAPPVNYATGNTPYGVTVGDLNHDGHLDLVVPNVNGNNVSVLLGNGDGTFKPAVNYPASQPVSVAIADFNGDGNPDLAVAEEGNGSVFLMLGDGKGGFAPGKNIAFSSGQPQTITAADLNGDGKPDLVVCGFGGGLIVMNLGNGQFTSSQLSPFTVGTLGAACAVGDLDGDGKPDIAATEFEYGLPSYLHVYHGNGNGTFQAAGVYSAGMSAFELAIGDVNGDGIPDIVVNNFVYLSTVSVLLGSGGGVFQSPVAYSTSDHNDNGVVLADFNGDGNLDIAAPNVLAGNGDGTFQNPVMLMYGISIAAGDFNEDGKPDLAVPSNSTAGFVAVFLNQTTFLPPATHFSVSVPASVPQGASVNVTVSARDQFNNIATAYHGTVHFTSSDGAANLPADYKFVPADNGIHTFTVQFNTPGQQQLLLADKNKSSIQGAASTIVAGPAATFSLTAPRYVSQGSAFTFTATARDQLNDVAIAYTGTAHFASSDSIVVLPADYTFTGPDRGSHTFTGTTTLNTLGNQTISATDKSNGTITGTSSNIYVSGTTPTTVTLVLSGIAPAPARSLFRKAITFTATTNPTAATGTILLMDGGTVIGSGPLASGSATITVIIGTVGSHSLTALYSGDAAYSTASSTVLQLQRSPRPR